MNLYKEIFTSNLLKKETKQKKNQTDEHFGIIKIDNKEDQERIQNEIKKSKNK